MTGPWWLDGAFAIAFALVALLFASRLIATRRDSDWAEPASDTAHLLMGISMVVMFVPSADPLPAIAWILTFVVSSVWVITTLLTRQERGDTRHLRHVLISNVGMVYMFSTMGTGSGGDGRTDQVAAGAMATIGSLAHDHGAGSFNLTPLTIAFIGYFLLHAVWTGIQTVRASTTTTESSSGSVALSAPPVLFGVRTVGASDVVMGLGMSYMFAQMLP